MHKHILTVLNWFYPGLHFAVCRMRQYNFLRVQGLLEHSVQLYVVTYVKYLVHTHFI